MVVIWANKGEGRESQGDTIGKESVSQWFSNLAAHEKSSEEVLKIPMP